MGLILTPIYLYFVWTKIHEEYIEVVNPKPNRFKMNIEKGNDGSIWGTVLIEDSIFVSNEVTLRRLCEEMRLNIVDASNTGEIKLQVEHKDISFETNWLN